MPQQPTVDPVDLVKSDFKNQEIQEPTTSNRVLKSLLHYCLTLLRPVSKCARKYQYVNKGLNLDHKDDKDLRSLRQNLKRAWQWPL